ncbi:MAG: undecaprenyl-diphosphate phosphatase [Caldimicrobium sp.]|nr:undecaprenyl-diphosphate phosphatase [Caldimicrobium sp.]MCX7873732.1 undecaprenyl-diphosphate phosphatase [Caldimicrobium sp.]MDW8093656.1 undecaprenyl-diphosphate phosphatase [Caldimicrobium sp.]
MLLIYPLILGIIQGLTEFLPISSTGHLILFANFINFPSNLSFDAFIHLGSFLAILLYYHRELGEIWQYKRFIFLSAIPGALAGLSLESLIENYFRSPESVALMLIIMSLPMVIGERFGKKEKSIGDLTIAKALFIGCAQALALFPGTSRSGITISAGLLVGLKREEAAKFSFLAGAPLILGAGLYESLELVKSEIITFEMALTGFISSTLSSLLAIIFLLSFLKKHSMYAFVVYRLLLALIILSIYLN